MNTAVYCGTVNIYEDMETSAKSLIANSNVERVHFFIEHDEFAHELPPMISTHNVCNQAYFPQGSANYNSQYTYMTLMRAALFDLLPENDVVLSLDADTIANANVSAIFNIDVRGCYFAATPEKWAQQRPGLQYCNTGVSLYNLAMLRDGKGREIINVLNAHWLRWPEQDAFNYLCQGRIAHMPSIYNGCPWVINDGGQPHIIHYAAQNEYHNEALYQQWRTTPWPDVLEMHQQILELSR